MSSPLADRVVDSGLLDRIAAMHSCIARDVDDECNDHMDTDDCTTIFFNKYLKFASLFWRI